MNILIAGSDINAFLIAEYIKQQNNNHDIYITLQSSQANSTYTAIDIKENDINSICDFVKYNQIEFTIVTSPIAIANGVADELTKEGFRVFAPFSESARVTYLTSVAKKIIYKLKINTPKFGIFDRENIALDYVRNAKFPICIQNDLTLLERENEICRSFLKAKSALQKIFDSGNERIIIENYIDSKPVYMYFITDGFSAYPLISVEREENLNSIITTSPSEKITNLVIRNILSNVIYPLLDDIKKFSAPYRGIIGLKIKFIRNSFYVLEFYNGFQKYDLQSFLALLDDDLLSIMLQAADGNLSAENVNISPQYGYNLAVNKSKIVNNIDEDVIYSEDENNYIFSSTASTLNRAAFNMLETLEGICEKDYYHIIKQRIKQEE